MLDFHEEPLEVDNSDNKIRLDPSEQHQLEQPSVSFIKDHDKK